MGDTKQSLVTTNDNVVKEGNTDIFGKEWKSNQDIVEEAITPPISVKKNIDAVNKTEKSQASNKTVDTTKINKTETVTCVG